MGLATMYIHECRDPTDRDGRGNASRRSLVLAFPPSLLSTTVNLGNLVWHDSSN